MKTEDRRRKSEVGRWKFFLFCLLTFIFYLPSCSVPNLESPECVEARNAVKEFYSFHFGNDMKPSAENLKPREKFLSKELSKTLSGSKETTRDYFTATEDYPKAFRVGECGDFSQNDVRAFEILLFWKTDTREEQQEIRVIVIKENGKWVINEVGPKFTVYE